jgi:hypothetical protein
MQPAMPPPDVVALSLGRRARIAVTVPAAVAGRPVGDTSAHFAIAGPVLNHVAASWRTVGRTGFGPRQQPETAEAFTPSTSPTHAGAPANHAMTREARL